MVWWSKCEARGAWRKAQGEGQCAGRKEQGAVSSFVTNSSCSIGDRIQYSFFIYNSFFEYRTAEYQSNRPSSIVNRQLSFKLMSPQWGFLFVSPIVFIFIALCTMLMISPSWGWI
jgi:hypothetical protein